MGDAADPRELRRTFIVPAIKPFDHYDFARAKVACNLAWLVAKAFGTGRRGSPAGARGWRDPGRGGRSRRAPGGAATGAGGAGRGWPGPWGWIAGRRVSGGPRGPVPTPAASRGAAASGPRPPARPRVPPGRCLSRRRRGWPAGSP